MPKWASQTPFASDAKQCSLREGLTTESFQIGPNFGLNLTCLQTLCYNARVRPLSI